MTTKQNEISERGRKRKRRERERERGREVGGRKKINLPEVERPHDWDEMKYD